jgi:hypothetical protein
LNFSKESFQQKKDHALKLCLLWQRLANSSRASSQPGIHAVLINPCVLLRIPWKRFSEYSGTVSEVLSIASPLFRQGAIVAADEDMGAIGSMTDLRRTSYPMVVAVEMGYGHLRAAYTLAEVFGTEVIRMDMPPITGPIETAVWRATLRCYNALSRASEWPVAGPAARRLLEHITEITPLRAHAAREPANLITRLVDGLTGTVVGRGLRRMASSIERPILATFPAAALAASHAPGARIFCLATDTDLNRAWAPANAMRACIDYLAPVKRVVERLRSFGVPHQRIHLTGFPLPAKLVRQAQPALTRRLHRLDPATRMQNPAPRPIVLTIAIGGAGAQTQQVGQILRSLRGQVLAGKFSLTLVAGMRPDVAGLLREMVQSVGLASRMTDGIEILHAADLRDYFRRFEDCLADSDLLWTKPSELVFYAALGLPLLLAPPVGGQEHANRDWILSNGAGLDAGNPANLDQRLKDLFASGELSRIAWNAYSRLDRNGSDRILELVRSKDRARS